MKLRIYRTVTLLTAILFMLTERTMGQKTDSLKISAIPEWMKWENSPRSFQVQSGALIITSGEKTDMFRDPNVTYNTDNAPKLMFDADSDFVFSAAIEHAFTSKWDGGALVLKQDSLNWVKCCFEKDYTGARRVVTVVTKGISDDCNSVAITTNKVYLKIAKADNVITVYYSSTGRNWFLVRHFTFDATNRLQLGFLSQSPTGKSCTVRFTDIRYIKKKISDPYLGE